MSKRKHNKRKFNTTQVKATNMSKPYVAPAIPAVPAVPAIPERALTANDIERTTRYAGSVLMRFLNDALSIKRPHKGSGEKQILGIILRSLPADADWHFDSIGNLHVDMRTTTSQTLFVAHVDTVHSSDGVNAIRKTDAVWYADGSQLGADDGAGVAMLMHLLHGGVPAYYLFTIGEECGGIGAKFVADNYQHMLSGIKRAVAFDRRGTNSVITYQGWGRCCSDDFGYALADAFNATTDDLMYTIDDTGVYTDTAEFTDIVPECTNISIGYQREHSTSEALDVMHMLALADACLAVDWESLPTTRDPLVPEPDPYAFKGDYGVYSGTSWAGAWGSLNDKHWDLIGDDEAPVIKHYTPTPREESVIEMLYNAQDTGNVSELSELMAKSVYPEDPAGARRLCVEAARRCIADDAYVDNCVEAILDGFPVDDVMLDIYSSFATV